MQPEHLFTVQIPSAWNTFELLFGAWEGRLDALVSFQAAAWPDAELTVFECTQPALSALSTVAFLTDSSCGWREWTASCSLLN